MNATKEAANCCANPTNWCGGRGRTLDPWRIDLRRRHQAGVYAQHGDTGCSASFCADESAVTARYGGMRLLGIPHFSRVNKMDLVNYSEGFWKSRAEVSRS